MVIGNRKGGSTKDRVRRNFGMPHPEGYRKALRAMKIAEKFGRPVISFIDLPGAYPGLGAEERGQAEAIARNLLEMSRLRVPTISVISGEGGSGGALALAVADRVLILENALYFVITPESCAAIMWRDAAHKQLAAEAMRISAPEVAALGCVDEIVKEPPEGIHADREAGTGLLGAVLKRHLAELKAHAGRRTGGRAPGQIPQHCAVLHGRLDAMSPSSSRRQPLRAYLRFIAAVLWFFVARALARHEALGLASEQWRPLAEQAMLLFLLLMGYASMGFSLDRQQHPLSAQGLPRRAGWPGEAGLGLAVGWALAVACVLPMVVGGGIAIVLVLGPSAWGWLLADAAFFALAALAEEVAFRGYGFQRFEQCCGLAGSGAGLCGLLCHCAGASAGIKPRQHRRFRGSKSCAFNRLPAHARTVGELGNQLRLEGQPRAALRAWPSAATAATRPWCRAIRWGRSGSPAEAMAWTAVGWRSLFCLSRCRWFTG